MATQRTTSRRFYISLSVAILGSLAALTGCQGTPDDIEEDVDAAELAISDNFHEGKRLFQEETFGGNGRTCATCHSKKTGTLSPEEIQARFAADPSDPLFLHDGSDDFEGNGVGRILEDATILVRVQLPPFVTLADDPAADHVIVRRGIPTTLNTPALDDVLMYDGRAPDLETQAADAIGGHAQAAPGAVTHDELAAIADYQKTNKFFTSQEMELFANGGDAPKLPKGHTAAEKRGRAWFEDAPIPVAINSGTPRKGLCAICHSGPMLNENNGFNPVPLPPFPKWAAPGVPDFTASCDTPQTQATYVPKGMRFQSVLVSEFNHAQNPTHTYLIHLPDGNTIPIPNVADPGRALITWNFQAFPSQDGLFTFKIPSLWGVKKTAPYFHDNSRKSLEDVVEHYALFFKFATECFIDGDPGLEMTAQDKADLVAYLKLL